MTELKEERKEEAWKNIQSLNNQLWKTIKKECKEIDAEIEIKCLTCGK